MKIIMSISVMIFLLSCNSIRRKPDEKSNHALYLVTKIKVKNSWNIIYAMRNNRPYKIVTKKEKNEKINCLNPIIVGRYYDLILNSRKSNVPEMNGVKIQPMNYLDIECYTFDEITNICIEPKKGIYDLYSASNVIGLCVYDQSKN